MLDDGIANKTLCTREANRRKNNRSPYDAFEQGEGDYALNKIASRVASFPPNKAWRFSPDAMERYENVERDFLDRQLNETRYISRLAREYLQATGADVWVTPGRLTADLRHQWGLNSVLHGHNREEAVKPEKNRNDHRHHAIDAVVVAMTDRSLLQAVATAAGRAERQEQKALDLIGGLEDPWKTFREDVRASVLQMVVSHKQDHGVEGRLHQDTAYGAIKDPETGRLLLATRKSLMSLTRGEISGIGDLHIRQILEKRTNGLSDKALAEELAKYSKETGTKRVRVHIVRTDYEVIQHGRGYTKAVISGDNFCIDIVETDDGVWRCVGVTRLEAARERRLNSQDPKWQRLYPNAEFTMRLHKDDLLRLNYDGRETTMCVVQLDPRNNRVLLVEHFEAGNFDKRNKAPADVDPFRWDRATISRLKSRKARLVHVDPAGAVHDPGPPH